MSIASSQGANSQVGHLQPLLLGHGQHPGAETAARCQHEVLIVEPTDEAQCAARGGRRDQDGRAIDPEAATVRLPLQPVVVPLAQVNGQRRGVDTQPAPDGRPQAAAQGRELVEQ